MAPVGDDTIERIWMPLKSEEADKVYLLTMQGEDKYAEKFAAVKRAILEQDLVRPERLVELRENLYDYAALMCLFARICRDEQVRNSNHVFFNVSTGGKLIAHAAMLACLIFDATPYYCKQKYPDLTVEYPPTLLPFPRYPVEKPDPEIIRFLVTIRDFMRVKKRTWVSKSECVELDPARGEGGRTTLFKKLKYRYLDKLAKWHFATVEPQARGKVSVTEEGHLAAQIFEEYYAIPVVTSSKTSALPLGKDGKRKPIKTAPPKGVYSPVNIALGQGRLSPLNPKKEVACDQCGELFSVAQAKNAFEKGKMKCSCGNDLTRAARDLLETGDE